MLSLFPAGCSPEQSEVDFSLETFQVESGWGYKIYKKEKSFIIQENIPAISKNKTFDSRKDAEKVGLLVIQKLEKNKMPSITISELDSLKINY